MRTRKPLRAANDPPSLPSHEHASGLAAGRRNRMRKHPAKDGDHPQGNACIHPGVSPSFIGPEAHYISVSHPQLPEPIKIDSTSDIGLLGPGRNSLARSGARSPSVTPLLAFDHDLNSPIATHVLKREQYEIKYPPIALPAAADRGHPRFRRRSYRRRQGRWSHCFRR